MRLSIISSPDNKPRLTVLQIEAQLLRRVKRGIKAAARYMGVDVRRSSPETLDYVDTMRQWSGARNIECIVDIGANVGQSALEFVKQFPNAQIYSIEPAPETYKLLQKNTQLYPQIHTFQVALGDRPQKMKLHLNRSSATNSLLHTAAAVDQYNLGEVCEQVGETEVEVLTLDDFCQVQNIDTIDLLKMDVQGYERHVLEGANEMLSPNRIHAIYLEVNFVPLYEAQAYADEILALLRKRGYRLFGFYEPVSTLEHGLKWANALFG